MKAAINQDGLLSIERAGVLQRQFCPFQAADDLQECGDWCPMFGEPDIWSQNLVSISICNGKVIKLDSLDDRRSRFLAENTRLYAAK